MIALYWAWRLGMWVTAAAPRRLSLAIAGWIGMLGYYGMPLRRQVAKENFAHVIRKDPDDPAVRRIAREAFLNFTRHMRDVMLYPSTSIQELEQRITIHHPEHFEQALAMGQGTIIVSAHFGNMDMPAAVLANRFKPITLVSETLRPQQLMDLLTRARAEKKVLLFPYDSAPRRIIEALKRNEITAFLLDFGVTHHFDLTTVPVVFFGTETNFPTGPAQIALMTGAAIVVGHAHVAPDGHIDVHTDPPIFVQRSGDRRRDIQTTMQTIAQRMEAFIRLYPEQWYIFRPMWNGASSKRKIPSLSKPSPPRKDTV